MKCRWTWEWDETVWE